MRNINHRKRYMYYITYSAKRGIGGKIVSTNKKINNGRKICDLTAAIEKEIGKEILIVNFQLLRERHA